MVRTSTSRSGARIRPELGERGTLKTFEVSYRGIDVPGRPYRCSGRVTKVDGPNVDLEVWGEDPAGARRAGHFENVRGQLSRNRRAGASVSLQRAGHEGGWSERRPRGLGRGSGRSSASGAL